MNVKYKKTDLAVQLETELNIDFSLTRAHSGDAGVDLRCCSLTPVYLFPGTITEVFTGVCVWVGSLPSGSTTGLFSYTGVVVPRSSCEGVILRNTVGVIDDPYQGQIILKWFNPLDRVIQFNPGDKVAQLLVVPVFVGEFTQVGAFAVSTSRAEQGFGSSGVQ